MTKPPIEKFTIDLNNIAKTKDDLKEQQEKINEQISNIVERMKIDDNPILIPILGMTHKRSALEKLARALTRVAPLIDEYEKLERKLTCLQVASEEAGWLAANLGEFQFDFEGAAGWESPKGEVEEDDGL